MFEPPFPPWLPFLALRRHALPFAPAFATKDGFSAAANARYFRNPPARPPWRDDPPPPPPDDRNRFEPHNPLSEREQRAYLILTGIGCLPFLLLILLAIHHPQPVYGELTT